MQVLSSARGKRSFTYSFIILIVISIFVLGYLFHFIPQNKRTVENNAFLILQIISENIKKAVDARATFYTNNYNKVKELPEAERKSTIEELIKANNIDADVQFHLKASKGQRDSVKAYTRIGNGNLNVAVAAKPGADSVEYIEAMDSFLQPFLSSQKKELFRTYIIGKLDTKPSELIYSDEEIALRSDVGLDSILPKMGTQFLSGTRDLVVQEVKMKMFYYPFKIGNSQFIICGFLPDDTYQASLRKIPFYFIYPLAIAFLLLLISLPILKFYIMDSNEQVTLRDVILFGLSVFLGAAFITQMIIQYLLWKGEEIRIEEKLETIADNISNDFKNELVDAYKEMEILDTVVKDVHINPRIVINKKDSLKADASQVVQDYLAIHSRDSNYYHFERISWVDSAGNQRIKAELHSEPVYTKVDKRKYFTIFNRGDPYYLPGDSSKRFGWEAINSWTNGDFNITISSKGPKYVTALATKMSSLVDVVLPVGFGYCIIDENGNVQVHSDENRNLQENFFRKISPSEQLKGIVAARQHRIMNDVILYGKLHMVAVQPLQPSMPYYLVTFYDKGHIVPVNMRILIFTLLLCLLSFFLCAAIWYLLRKRNPKNNPLLFCKMDFLTWITSRSTERTYYKHGAIFLGAYFFSVIGYALFYTHYYANNFNILVLLLVTPFNVIITLNCMRGAFLRPVARTNWNVFEWDNELIFAIFHFLGSLLLYFWIRGQYLINIWFLLFQLIVSAVIWYYVLQPQKAVPNASDFKGTRLRYKFLITGLVFCLAVLPSAMFTWYAHNQELMQTTKRQQLYLAKAIHERSYRILDMKGNKDTNLLPKKYLDSLEFSKGIYSIYVQKIEYTTCTKDTDAQKTFENFYFSIADNVSIPYYDQQSYAALRDEAYDDSWNWIRRGNFIELWYKPRFPSRSFTPNIAREECLHIVSAIPRRFVFFGDSKKWIPLLIVIFALCYGMFQWLGRNTNQIFLIRYIYSRRILLEQGEKGVITEYFAGKKISDDESIRRLYSSSRYIDYSIQCDQQKLLQFEEEIVDDLNNGKEFYAYVWSNTTEKEKFLLFDYAQDGLINYKNTKEIIELLKRGIFIIEDERLRIFSPGFRAYILTSIDKDEINAIQKKCRENSTWHYVRVPLLLFLFGIAAVLFFTQQGVFDKLLILAGGVSTLLTIALRFIGGGGGSIKEAMK